MKHEQTKNYRQQGFSLVELMTALLIGLLLMGGLSTMFVTTKRNYTAQDSMARLQENGRIALQILSREIRAAGYYGCANTADSITNTLNGGASSFGRYSTDVPLQGAESTESGGTLLPGAVALPAGAVSDAISLRYADSENAFQLNGQMNTSAAALPIEEGSASGIRVGDILFISDCTSAAVFQVTTPAAACSDGTLCEATTLVHNKGAGDPGNSTQKLGKQFDTDAKVMKFVQVTYYIAPGTSGQPALWRSEMGNAVELIDGIEAMEILYGIDTNADGSPNQYIKAGSASLITEADWKNVKSVRVGIVARALANKTISADKAQTRTAGEADVTPDELKSIDIDGDGDPDLIISTLPLADQPYQRRVFRTTLMLRNM